MSDIKKSWQLEWRLNVVMSERRIKTITELKRRLGDIGVHISSAQLGRVVWECPQKINTELLAGLVTVLDCAVSDIIRVSKSPATEQLAQPAVVREPKVPKERKERVKPLQLVKQDDLLGPKLTPYPVSPREK